ncbi:MAG TPA: GAF domain-containing protein, partial [Actinomycetota bacterium]|nr:GAF domain-containing protein [Actinomycetota bacterium]
MQLKGTAPRLDPLERLERVQRVSDTALSHLSVDELLDELLERVREILDADTAAVLLLDESRNELVARAAKGIEEEVERGVRIPVGKGFAGRIAAERTPVSLSRVDHDTVLNPILFQKSIRSLLGVPLLANGDLIGVMHVGTKSRRRFTPDEVDLLQVVADRVALALSVRLSNRSRIVIEAFQRTFLPDVLPFIPGFRVATRYLPAATAVGVGGDWFDAFVRPEGDIVVVIGDVAGHGLPAASLMGKMRNALRAHALMGGTALDILVRADEFHRHFGRGRARDDPGRGDRRRHRHVAVRLGRSSAAARRAGRCRPVRDRSAHQPAARAPAAALVHRGGGRARGPDPGGEGVRRPDRRRAHAGL